MIRRLPLIAGLLSAAAVAAAAVIIPAESGSPAPETNILVNGDFGSGIGLAGGWLDEVTATGRPQYALGQGVQHIRYTGLPSDPGPEGRAAKLEVFQVAYQAISPGTRWRFTVTVSGTVAASYLIAGIEWFDARMRWISETDSYPGVTAVPQRISVTSAVLAPQTRYICVYLIFPEIGPRTRVDVSVRDASLVRVADLSGQAGAVA